jgi:hypothetical protein
VSDAAAAVSAAMALLSLLFTIYVYSSTRKLLRPFERPTLSLVDSRVGLGADGNVGYALKIKNTGQRPASKIRFQVRAAPEKDLKSVVNLLDREPAHDYQPNGEMELMIWPPKPFDSTTLMQVIQTYSDGLANKKYEGESYWLVVFPGDKGAVTVMTQKERKGAETAWGGSGLN